MNIKNIIIASVFLLAVSCVKEEIPFAIDTEKINIDCYGGVRTLKVSSDDRWVAIVDTTWVSVSPANGMGVTDCNIYIDSSLFFRNRTANIRIQSVDDAAEYHDFQIVQSGFRHEIVTEKPQVNISDFASYEDRTFDLKVMSNVRFSVDLTDTPWLEFVEEPAFNLDRGARPRPVVLKFRWKVNTEGDPRIVDSIKFVPSVKDGVSVDISKVTIRQEAGPDLERTKGTAEGDSLALIAISRALGCMAEFEVNEKMANWTGVTVWKTGEKKGRVRSAQFAYFNTEESLPYAVKYLTMAEELVFYSNTNSFMKDIELGDEICELDNLKKLTMFSYGIVDLPERMSEMKSLRYLDLTGNNLQKIPDVLYECKNLKALFLTSNQRGSIPDLKNTVKTDVGGLFNECVFNNISREYEFPKRLLAWNQLDTLRLSVNYLQGKLPTDKELLECEEYQFTPWDVDKWDETATEVHLADSLGENGKKFFTDNKVPMVLPDIDFFSINLNRLHGDIPNWLKYHPKLDMWTPLILVFPQEGKDSNGNRAGFNQEPTNLNYYYDIYEKKEWSDVNVIE